MVLGDMHLKPGEAWEYCPREASRRVSKILKDEFNLVLKVSLSLEECAKLHVEARKGQFELALGYTLCSNAADNLIFTREVVRSVARKHGLVATFMPK
ncbi:Glutamine synthetase [Camellia lanceoleosa]|uniref:Glutamine synthetase n=1 Tax=Camellia lanceoleosa TaxID=1840588 RepID=A0ACC0GC77_9ERIC|nr:Glutamine synthetase [Camellia lanceoleosa]